MQLVKGEQCIVMRTRDAKIVLTNAVSGFIFNIYLAIKYKLDLIQKINNSYLIVQTV